MSQRDPFLLSNQAEVLSTHMTQFIVTFTCEPNSVPVCTYTSYQNVTVPRSSSAVPYTSFLFVSPSLWWGYLLLRSSVLPTEPTVTTVSSLGKTSVTPKRHTRLINKQLAKFQPQHVRRCYTGCVTLDVTSVECTEILLYRVCHLRRDKCWVYWDTVIQDVSPETWQVLSVLRCCYTGVSP
jgi:hypothetical protein